MTLGVSWPAPRVHGPDREPHRAGRRNADRGSFDLVRRAGADVRTASAAGDLIAVPRSAVRIRIRQRDADRRRIVSQTLAGRDRLGARGGPPYRLSRYIGAALGTAIFRRPSCFSAGARQCGPDRPRTNLAATTASTAQPRDNEIGLRARWRAVAAIRRLVSPRRVPRIRPLIGVTPVPVLPTHRVGAPPRPERPIFVHTGPQIRVSCIEPPFRRGIWRALGFLSSCPAARQPMSARHLQ